MIDMKQKYQQIKSNLGFYAFILLLILSLLGLFFYGIYTCYRFTHIYDKAVTVEAVVVDHYTSTDPEEGSTHYSYITYTYGGEVYERKQYESSGVSADELTPIGEKVFIKINSENPGQFISDVSYKGSFLTIVPGSLIIIVLVWFLKNAYHERIEYQPVKVVNKQTVEKYLKEKIKCRKTRTIFLALAIWICFLRFIFPLVFANMLPFIIVLLAAFFLFLGKDIVDLICIKKSYYTICHGKLTEKYIDHQEQGLEYCLVFSFHGFPYKYKSGFYLSQYTEADEDSEAYVVYYNYKKNTGKDSVLSFFKINNKIISK